MKHEEVAREIAESVEPYVNGLLAEEGTKLYLSGTIPAIAAILEKHYGPLVEVLHRFLDDNPYSFTADEFERWDIEITAAKLLGRYTETTTEIISRTGVITKRNPADGTITARDGGTAAKAE